MPKNCPLNKVDSHACWECPFKAGDSCLAPIAYKAMEMANEKVKFQVANCECLDCFHFKVCSRLMGGMDLVKCEDYLSSSNVHVLKADMLINAEDK